jgi:hypothetical protein
LTSIQKWGNLWGKVQLYIIGVTPNMALTVRQYVMQSLAEKAYSSFMMNQALSIQVTPKGGKWWRFKYRYLGKEKLMSLGTYPDVSLLMPEKSEMMLESCLLKTHLLDPSEFKKVPKTNNI